LLPLPAVATTMRAVLLLLLLLLVFMCMRFAQYNGPMNFVGQAVVQHVCQQLMQPGM
jgi:hypothetical protein